MLLPRALLRTFLTLALVAPVSACGDDDTDVATAFTTVSAATLEPGDAIPVPTDPVLTVTGPDTEVAFDLASIESAGTVRSTVDEPFLLREVEFEGVWVRDLLDLVAPSGVTTISMHALDDYVVHFGLADLGANDALLATRAAGERISIEDGGPIRLVFLDPDGIGANADLWIWSIDGFTLS